ncbi:MAG: Uma2 family endonuclease [Candidatus Tectomicrobia bacterium]|uniref:Uma2 family endonuclease n=1 Tax=Tectimicrobiota bacterium TaxID=2528274 RepID=A0A932CP01_UNCTE|nr:Uma2 family endonuclease [Candidatus Tectomicrobia bacterium]
MAELGLIGPEERLELIEGEIIQQMVPQKSLHATAICLVEEALRLAFGAGFLVRVQLPLVLSPLSEPEPDVAVVRGGPRDYRDVHPTTALLVVEVADTTLAFDRRTKGSLYARAQIADYWILNLPAQAVEVYRRPMPRANAPLGFGYADMVRYLPGESVTPLASPHAVLVADLLP